MVFNFTVIDKSLIFQVYKPSQLPDKSSFAKKPVYARKVTVKYDKIKPKQPVESTVDVKACVHPHTTSNLEKNKNF